MFINTVIATLALAAPALADVVTARQGPITTEKVFLRAVTADVRFLSHPLGMYHPDLWNNPYEGIADLWGAPSPPSFDTDYVYLTGETSDTLALVWNREKAQSLYFDAENSPLLVNNSATGDVSKQLKGLSIGADQLIHIKDDAFTFTACIDETDFRTVSYLKKGSTGLADNCTPIKFLVAERLGKKKKRTEQKSTEITDNGRAK